MQQSEDVNHEEGQDSQMSEEPSSPVLQHGSSSLPTPSAPPRRKRAMSVSDTSGMPLEKITCRLEFGQNGDSGQDVPMSSVGPKIVEESQPSADAEDVSEPQSSAQLVTQVPTWHNKDCLDDKDMTDDVKFSPYKPSMTSLESMDPGQCFILSFVAASVYGNDGCSVERLAVKFDSETTRRLLDTAAPLSSLNVYEPETFLDNVFVLVSRLFYAAKIGGVIGCAAEVHEIATGEEKIHCLEYASVPASATVEQLSKHRHVFAVAYIDA